MPSKFKRLALSLLSYRQAESLRSLLYGILYYTGFARLLGRPAGAVVLIYHSVSEESVFWDNRITPEEFERQVAYLRSHYTVVPLSEVIKKIRAGEDPPTDWIAITFDDGYADNLRTAVPILRKHGVTATFFPTVGVVSPNETDAAATQPFFYDQVQRIVEATPKQRLSFDCGGGPHVYDLSDADVRDDAALRIVLDIRDRPDEERREVVRRLADSCEVDPAADTSPYLAAADLRGLVAAGMEVGSHTMTHPNLPVLPTESLEREVAGSKNALERILGRGIAGFAYPFGKRRNYDEKTIESVRKAGYQYALTTTFGRVTKNTDPFQIPRVAGRGGLIARLKVNLLGIEI